MLKKCTVLLALLLWSATYLSAQKLTKFSDTQNEFMSELKTYMTSGKQKDLAKTFKEFEKPVKAGLYSEEEIATIIQVCNGMLSKKMGAKPFFKNYLTALPLVKDLADQPQLFNDWHTSLMGLLADMVNRKVVSYRDYLKFSLNLFKKNALKYSSSGSTTWFASSKNYQLIYKDKIPMVVFDETDLLAVRKKDSISIHQTKGTFFPLTKRWEGDGGTVDWKRYQKNFDIAVRFDKYTILLNKSIYHVDKATFQYPSFFGSKVLTGKFTDKLISLKESSDSGYPRFEADQKTVEIENIGEGVAYKGGFKIYGTTVYGIGTKENKAQLKIRAPRGKEIFRGKALSFVIKRGERISAEQVESTLLIGNDSIYHPSVNIRYVIPKKLLQLTRGERGSDRNPFYDSYRNFQINTNNIDLYVAKDSLVIGKPTVSVARKGPVEFESFQYFSKSDYDRFQSISSANPLAIMKATVDMEGSNFVDASTLAKRMNSKFSIKNIERLLYNLVARGFVNYDPEEEIVEIKPKLLHYTMADRGAVDYDYLKLKSEVKGVNAQLNTRGQDMIVNGIKNIEFSHKHQVAIQPYGQQIVLKKDRDIDFDGKVFAGMSVANGKDFHYVYGQNYILLDSVKYWDLYAPTGERDKQNHPIAEAMSSRIEHINGVLLVDAPQNKSGKENIPSFPSLQSKTNSFVYYDKDSIQGGVYERDSFYFELKPFSFNQLDDFSVDDIQFKGKLVAAGIFPDISQTLVLRDDNSLGFKAENQALPLYGNRGSYKGQIDLSNKGLKGEGNFKYLGASINSEDFVMKPKAFTGSADKFELQENRTAGKEVPKVFGEDVTFDWRPYKDSLYVRTKAVKEGGKELKKPFFVYNTDGGHKFTGVLILTPGGLKGKGLLDWQEGSLYSKLTSLGAFSSVADTANLKIKALEEDAIALKTDNVNSDIDFDKREGHFIVNNDQIITELPKNKYITKVNEFTWDMKRQKIEFKPFTDKLQQFVSIDKAQDSLRFEGKHAVYDLKTNTITVSEIPYVIAADAFIYPDSNYVVIEEGGKMRMMENAKIIADTINKYHVINRAKVEIFGRKEYRASGFYEYNLPSRKQEIEFQNIVGQRYGKGNKKTKQVITKATGEVKADNHFYIDKKTEFQGTISMTAASKKLKFTGFARLDADKLPKKIWFTVSSDGDKKDLAIAYKKPKSIDGVPLETGIFLSKETSLPYPSVMMGLWFRKDRRFFPVTGLFKYNEKFDQFVFGDSSRVIANLPLGNKLTYDNRFGTVEGNGSFNVCDQADYVKVKTAGTAKIKFGPVPTPTNEDSMEDEDNMMPDEEGDGDMMPDTAEDEPAPVPQEDTPLTAELMTGIEMYIPEKLLKIVTTDFEAGSFTAPLVSYLTDINFYKEAATNLFKGQKGMEESINGMTSGFFDLPSKYNPHTFLFSKLKLKWNPNYQSFVTTEDKSGIIAINGRTINRMATVYVELKMPANGDDRVYIYMKSPSGLYYFFGYKQGILNIVSDNPSFMDEIQSMKPKEFIKKMKDGNSYEIQVVEPGTAMRFMNRVKSGR